jgi:hypothetical protein
MPRKSNALAKAMEDGLIAALVDKMPAPAKQGEPKTVWPKPKRTRWLDLLSRSFDEIYDDAPSAEAGGALTGAAGQSTQATPPKIFIAPDGCAMAISDEFPHGRMIDPHQIPMSTVVMDYRPLPIDDEVNPISWLTAGAKAMRLPAGVKLRHADGPMPAATNGSGEAGAGADA